MRKGFTEQDWKLFRAKLPAWQEAYMDRLNREYIELLQSDRQASDKFWTLCKRIREDKHHAGVQVEMKRFNFLFNIANLLSDGAITLDDLKEFSPYFLEAIHLYIQKPGGKLCT